LDNHFSKLAFAMLLILFTFEIAAANDFDEGAKAASHNDFSTAL
jgi:hypothetical protein